MLYYLLYHVLQKYFSPLNVFRYITVRTVYASLTAMFLALVFGPWLISKLRDEKVAENVPVVVFSADRDAREKAKKLSADAALRKPFELEELQDVVERLLPTKPAA